MTSSTTISPADETRLAWLRCVDNGVFSPSFTAESGAEEIGLMQAAYRTKDPDHWRVLADYWEEQGAVAAAAALRLRYPATVRQLVGSQTEPDHPVGVILQFFNENAGKRLDTRTLARLQERVGHPVISVERDHGMTRLTWEGTYPDGRPASHSLFLAYRTVNVQIDPLTLVNQNHGWFQGRVDRSLLQQQVLADASLLEDLQAVIDAFKSTRARLRSLLKDPRLAPWVSAIEQAFGL